MMSHSCCSNSMDSLQKGKRWSVADSKFLLEIVIENVEIYIASRGSKEMRFQFFGSDKFAALLEKGRNSEQIYTRFENIMKEYRRKLKLTSVSGLLQAGTTEEEERRTKFTIFDDESIFDLCVEIESKVNRPANNGQAPALFVREKVAREVVLMRPSVPSTSILAQPSTVPPRACPASKLDIRQLCVRQTELLQEILNNQREMLSVFRDLRNTLVSTLAPPETDSTPPCSSPKRHKMSPQYYNDDDVIPF